jgi:hypothetical protein
MAVGITVWAAALVVANEAAKRGSAHAAAFAVLRILDSCFGREAVPPERTSLRICFNCYSLGC